VRVGAAVAPDLPEQGGPAPRAATSVCPHDRPLRRRGRRRHRKRCRLLAGLLGRRGPCRVASLASQRVAMHTCRRALADCDTAVDLCGLDSAQEVLRSGLDTQ
jgi:hypothetical protein